MSVDVTHLLGEIERGNTQASEELLPILYNELRELARKKMLQESVENTLQATALVHEAYLRLVGSENNEKGWQNRGHFFAAAAQAMRRILVDAARRRAAAKRGGGMVRKHFDEAEITLGENLDVLAVNEALDKLETQNPEAALLVNLRYFAGLTIKEAAVVLDVSPRKTDQIWAYAKAWLITELEDE